ncbi:nuclear transport factor 2 family protein [Azohydromonas lata]|uniref:Nuclear transport factor 2 family protein n=1 Tax=Azohydromonas lata TaxID=45677 RepID=A0ABU5INZ7_9BURK|nr:nuclear transport factor 2 family protein [Azohydromonas lata]MDZ5460599.1 nuclear transport factor 2 family protein [Azohydromonas lata]
MTVSVGSTVEIDAITQVLEVYMNAAKNGRGKDMKPAFADQATIFGYVGDNLAFQGPIQSLFDWHDKNGSAKEVVARITHIDVVGTVAHARVEAENWTSYKFTDLFLLIKLDGEWKIINKVFHLH